MNRLGLENSVYLQQHAHNPVRWWAWSKEAFEKASSERKPVLISIGYSTCHWCHVMERESFEDEQVAKLLNDGFIAIKVDREEHPDVDHFYMEALHTMVARGGWPLNIFVTPDRTPFFGGTYFPKAQFLQLLENIREVWHRDPAQIGEQGQRVLSHMRREEAAQDAAGAESSGAFELRARWENWMRKLGERQLMSFDPVWGGFGGAPKFPRSHATSALLRAADVTADARRSHAMRHAVTHTLRGMAYGGIWDHVGGGFHRYSTDEEWHVPHFEKMLYDQALLVQTYAEHYLATKSPLDRAVVAGVLNYLESEMRLPWGAWAAAQDADSEGVEGKFFVWSREEVDEALGPEEAERFAATYDVSAAGNWEGNNVPRLSLESGFEVWRDAGLSAARRKLYDRRRERIAPLRDGKVLVAWNGWMASALITASYAFAADDKTLSEALLKAALKTLRFFLDRAPEASRLAHIYYGEERFEEASLEDHAALIEALQMASGYADLGPDERGRFRDEASRRIAWVEKNFRDENGKLVPRRTETSKWGVPWHELPSEDGATPSAYSTYAGVLARALFQSDGANGQGGLSPENLERRFRNDLVPGARVSDRHPLALSSWLNQLEILARGVSIKVPSGEFPSWLATARKLGLRPSEFSVVEQAREDYELCEWGACFAKTPRMDEAGAALAKRLRSHQTGSLE